MRWFVPRTIRHARDDSGMDRNWLPEGHTWDLHIVHGPRGRGAGDFTGGGWKLIWHTTESPWTWADDGASYLVREGKEPHFIIGGRRGTEHPVVHQMLPLDVAGRALENNVGDGYQTNRANAIQVEICAAASEMATFGHYRALANLAELIMHRREIPNWTHAEAGTVPTRLSDTEFVAKQGMLGHNQAPDNNHTDPGRGFRWNTLQRLITEIPDGGYAL